MKAYQKYATIDILAGGAVAMILLSIIKILL